MTLSRRTRVRLTVESLDDRITPAFATVPTFDAAGVTAATVVLTVGGGHTVAIRQQDASNALPSGPLPNGDTLQVSGVVLPGHGLKTAQANNPVIDWSPTGTVKTG